MSFSPGLFYVYIASSPTDIYSLVAFASRASADEFWRTIQEKKHRLAQNQSSKRAGSGTNPRTPDWDLRRFSSQYIVSPHPCSDDPISQWEGALRVRIQSMLPPDPRPDNVNGGVFYIRSAIHPKFFWSYNLYFRERIELSGSCPAKFIIRRTTPLPYECREDEDILIGSDDINIWLYFHDHRRNEWREEMIVRGPNQTLTRASQLGDELQPEDGVFKFHHFSYGFAISGGAMEDVPVQWTPDTRRGDRWEFVN